MSTNQQIVDCPICMEEIECTKNCTTTECGHCFHSSCLMKSVAHNGFGCPYCRSVMAEEIKDEEEVEDWESVSSEEEEDDYALRGFRFLMNNLLGEQHDSEDEEEEKADEENSVEEEIIVKPSAEYLTQKLIEQGITMEQMVRALLLRHDEYEADDATNMRIDGQIFGKMRSIINRYTPPSPDPNTYDPNTVNILEFTINLVNVDPTEQHQLIYFDLNN
jgi:hypothetical protein